MDKKARDIIKTAQQAIIDLRKERDVLQDKVASVERLKLAEEIALMKVAAGNLEWDSLLEERTSLFNSGKDLGKIKLAFQEIGVVKDASTTEKHNEQLNVAESHDEPKHIAAARQEWEDVLEN